MAALYEAYSTGGESPLAPLPVQYADFAHWQREHLSGDMMQGHLDYWTRQLSGLAALSLPTDRPRPAVLSGRGGLMKFELSPALQEALLALARREGCTPFMLLLAAFQALLGRYSGQDDVAVGTPIAGRNRAETEGLIGFFVNTLVIRSDLSGDPTFREFLARIRAVALAAFQHQDLPYDRLVSELASARESGRAELFRVSFALQNSPQAAARLPRLKLAPLETATGREKFDLTLSMWVRKGTVGGSVSYSTDLFDPSTIARLIDHFRTLLEGVAANPDGRLSQILLLTAQEREKLVEQGGAESDH
jgi:non-ribosomal peptide synthetase component F